MYKEHNLLALVSKQYIFASRYKEVPKLSLSALENIIKIEYLYRNIFCLKNEHSHCLRGTGKNM